MVILDQNPPATPVTLHAANYALTSVLNDDAHGAASEGICAGVDRVGQDVMDGWIYRRSPNDPIGRITNRQCGKWNLLLPEPHQNLPDRLQLVELPEYEGDRFLNSPIGALLDFVEP
jgi:hypothetical protein